MHRPPPHFALASGGLIQLAIDGSGPETPAPLFQSAKQGNFEKCGIYRAKRGFAKSSLPGTRKARLATMAMELQSRQSRGRSIAFEPRWTRRCRSFPQWVRNEQRRER